MKIATQRQLELIPGHMFIDLHIGWYYCFNPKKKPYKNTIMPACELIDIADTPIGKRCTIQVIGDVGTREVYLDELAPMVMVRPVEAGHFAKLFPVQPDQMKVWGRSW